MINRLLLVAVIILSFGIAGIIGYAVAYQQSPQSSLSSSEEPKPKHTQQEIADMQAELQAAEAALAENEKQQDKARNLMYFWQYQADTAEQCARSYSGSSSDWLYSDPDYHRASRSLSQQTAIQCRHHATEEQSRLYYLADEHQELLERKLLLVMKLEATQ